MRMKSISISSVIIIILGMLFAVSMVSSFNQHKENKTLASKIKGLEEELKAKENEKEETTDTKTLVSNEALLKSVKERTNSFVTTFYNYDNANYTDRLYSIQKYTKEDVLTTICGDKIEKVKAPKTKISNKINKLELYPQLIDSKNATAIIVMNATYTVSGVGSGESTNQILKVGLVLENEEWIVNDFSLLGSGSTFSGE